MPPRSLESHPSRARDSGFTLVETLVALLLITFGLLAVAPAFVYAAKVTASSSDLGTLGGLAVKKLEGLRQTKFASLPPGGDLSSNVSGYYDASDPAATVRWTIVNNATPATKKTITLLAIATRTRSMGAQKSVQLTTLKAK